MRQVINIGRFLSSNSYCDLSHMLLEHLNKSITNVVVIDLLEFTDCDVCFMKLLNHFDSWFPKRVVVINY